jgi:hypothetical protein
MKCAEGLVKALARCFGPLPFCAEKLSDVRMERWIIDNQARYGKGVFVAVGDAFASEHWLKARI